MIRTFLVFLFFASTVACPGQQIVNPPAPDTLNRPTVIVNTQPLSDIDIPIRIGLLPIYKWANSYIDTLYTSPNYPNDWVLDGCDVRYQYRFVRGPFQFSAVNNILYVKFTGYYGVRGSTRLCTGMGNTAWTPSCSCGFGTEKSRRIDAGFAIQFRLQPDYRLGLVVNRVEPVPVDKCSVCFFGKDITKTVADELRTELDASVAEMQKQLQTFSLKPYLQSVWDTLQSPYQMSGFGYLSVQPQQLRISQAALARDSLFLSLGLTARPELKTLPEYAHRPLPNLSDFRQRSGFKIFVAEELPYDSLSQIANQQVAGQEFQVGKGLLKKTIRIDSMQLKGAATGIIVKVFASKAANGVFYLEGKPKWNSATQELWLDSLDYHIETRQWLIRTASSMFDGTITNKLKTYTRFNLQQNLKDLIAAVKDQMNRELYPGVTSKGFLSKLTVDQIKASEKGVYVAATAEGKLWIDVDAGSLITKFTQ